MQSGPEIVSEPYLARPGSSLCSSGRTSRATPNHRVGTNHLPVLKPQSFVVSITARRVCPALVVLVFLGSSFTAVANRIDRIDPSKPGFPDEYFLSVNPNSPTASLTETGIDRRSTSRGRRDVSLDLNGGTSAYSSKQYADSFLEFNNDADTSAVLTLAYGMGGVHDAGPMHNRYNAIGIDVSEVNSGDGGLSLGSGRFTLTLRSASGSATSQHPIDFNQPGTYYFSYNDPGFAGFDFTHLEGVVISLATTTPGTDFRIDDIFRTAIPEPSTWIMFSLGGAGLLAAGLRRDRAWAGTRFCFPSFSQGTGRNITVTQSNSTSHKRCQTFLDTEMLNTKVSSIRRPQVFALTNEADTGGSKQR